MGDWEDPSARSARRRTLAPLDAIPADRRALRANTRPDRRPGPRARPRPSKADEARVPEALNFANGLFRDRRYDLAAQEYEDFLKTSPAGPDGDDARFGLANARLFLGKYKDAKAGARAFLKAAPKDHPNAAAAVFRVGETAYLLGDLPAAKAMLEKFVAENPGHRHEEAAWSHLGDVSLRLKDYPRARKAYETVLGKPGGRLANRARLGLGQTLAAQGETDSAVKTLDELAKTGGPEWSDRARYESGRIELAAGRFDRAASAFEALEKASPRGPLAAEAKLRRAEALVRLDRRDEAEALLRPLVAGPNPSIAAQAGDALGGSLLARGKAADALVALDDASTKFAATSLGPLLRFHAAEAAQALGKLDDAKARFLGVAESSPDDPLADDAVVRAAAIALDARDLATAKALAQSVPNKFPRTDRRADAHLIEARVALAEKDAKGAIALLEAALGPDQPGPATAQAATYYLGLALRADGQTAKANELLAKLAKTPAASTAAGAQFMLGQGLIESGKYAEAIAPLEAYLKSQPDGEVADFALAHLARARSELGRPDEAFATMGTLSKRFPKSKALPPAWLALAESAMTAKQYDRASEFFLLATNTDDPSARAQARSGLGWAFLKLNRAREAATAFEELLLDTPNDPRAPDAALARARAFESIKEINRAQAAYESQLDRYPRSHVAAPPALARARVLVEAKRPAEAAEAFARVEAVYPQAEALDVLLAEHAWALVDAGRPEQADARFARLLKEFPDSPKAADARYNLAESAFAAKAFDKVAPLLGPVVAEGSKARPMLIQSSLYRLGRTQAERKDWKGAGATFERLAKEFPDGSYRREAAFWGAETAFQSGDAKAAEAGFAALLAKPATTGEPEGLARTAKRRRAQALVQLERWADALAAADAYDAEAKSAADHDPHAADVDYARGRALQGLARFEEARTAYSRVIEARKGSELAAKSQFMRGETYFHEKNYRKALPEFLKVDYLYDAPAWQSSALLEAGKVHEQLGQWAEAAETYERLRSRFPTDPNAAKAKDRLDAARKRASS